MTSLIPVECRGWWRIVETGTWPSDSLDYLGPAMLSLTGQDDRLRMHYLLAHVTAKPNKTGVSFRWKGVWEFDEHSGTGTVRVGEDGRLRGMFRIKGSDDSTLVAERADAPNKPIKDPPPFGPKWGWRR